MKKLLYKEFSLATPLLTVLFLGFTVMTFIPGYPILCGVFFVCFGIFQSYQTAREDNDILYTSLLPVKKSDVVCAKYVSAVILQGIAFVLFSIFTFIRMFFLANSAVYANNVLMGANFVFLSFVLLIFAAFNVIFIGGFFKTAYRYGKPFVLFIVANFAIIAIAETLHHLPGMKWLNNLNFDSAVCQLPLLACAIVIYVISTVVSCKKSKTMFEKLDL